MELSKHCGTCRCHESPPPEPVKEGDQVVDRLTGLKGVVLHTTLANPPWHNGGQPFVSWSDSTKSYCYYYDKVK